MKYWLNELLWTGTALIKGGDGRQRGCNMQFIHPNMAQELSTPLSQHIHPPCPLLEEEGMDSAYSRYCDCYSILFAQAVRESNSQPLAIMYWLKFYDWWLKWYKTWYLRLQCRIETAMPFSFVSTLLIEFFVQSQRKTFCSDFSLQLRGRYCSSYRKQVPSPTGEERLQAVGLHLPCSSGVLCDVISHIRLPIGRWRALSPTSKIVANDHWCQLTKENKHKHARKSSSTAVLL